MLLHLDSVTYTYPGTANPAVSDITAVFPSGWTGVVGDNGSGKTTLARIACGELKPDSGFVHPALSCTYCRQETDEAPADLFDFACSYDRTALHARRMLDIDDAWAWCYPELSGGQRRRLQIACALWRRPDILVLDEPTNDIDSETREALESARHAFSQTGGVGILISHDRALLDALCSQCLFLSAGHATMRQGSYSQGALQARRERDTAASQQAKARHEVERISREAQRRRQQAAQSAAKRSKKNLDPRDHDARTKIDLAVYTGKDGVAGRLSSRMETRLAKAEEALARIQVEKRYESRIWADACVSKRACLAKLPAQTIIRGTLRLSIPDISISPTDHIVLTGRNGSGKSTLLRSILSEIRNDTPLLSIPQEPTEAQRAHALSRLEKLDRSQRGKVLSVVARLNSKPESFLGASPVSPGEMRKLMLALATLESPSLMVLDEPANHLDMDSIAALQGMIADFPGAVLMVTHDRRMAEEIATLRWRIIPVESEQDCPEGQRAFTLRID